jgi:hypothetical protein
MSATAYAFLQHRHLTKAGGKKESMGRDPTELAGRAPRHRAFIARLPFQRCPTAEDGSARDSSMNKSAKVVLGSVLN